MQFLFFPLCLLIVHDTLKFYVPRNLYQIQIIEDNDYEVEVNGGKGGVLQHKQFHFIYFDYTKKCLHKQNLTQ